MFRTYCNSLVVTGLLLSLSGCARQNGTQEAQGDVRAETQAAPAAPAPTPSWAKAGDPAIADVVQQVLPSVVSVSSTRTARMQSPMQFFFGGPPIERRQQGLGSGVILDAAGIVVTNNHVVAEAEEIQVTTNDGREFQAKTVGTDPKSDLAVLQLQGEINGLTPIAVGNSAALRLGEIVLAIGNPFGVGQTVTMGIVSAKGRANMGIVDYEDFIQTDAAINPGNSGGALVNMQGQLVGINTAILSRTGGNVGIGFAIPTDMAKPIVEALRKEGRVSRGWLGVAIQDVDADLQRALNLPTTSGVLIGDVQPDTPAGRAGVQRGDVVTHVDGQPVGSSGVFRNRIAAAGADATVELRLIRKGKEQTVSVKLGELPGESAGGPGEPKGGAGADGLAVRPLDGEARRQLGLGDEPQHGVVVERIEPNSAAARARLRPGDVILEVNRTPVKTPQEFRNVFGKARGDRLLLVHRQGSTFFVVVKG
jgi:serine protease Do